MFAAIALTSCKSDSKNETSATDTAATADAAAGKDMKDSLILTQVPTFTDQATINFSAEYDSFLSEYRKAVRENNTELLKSYWTNTLTWLRKLLKYLKN